MNIAVQAYEEGWMQTLGGGKFTPMAPKIEQITIADIAGALGKMCRYGGHCLRFYSVAEHSVLMARYASEENKLTALMHDASEAYLSDIIRPLKPHLTGYYAYEASLMAMISTKYGLVWPLPAEIKRLDTAMLKDERQQNMARMDVDPKHWGDVEPALGAILQFWSPGRAEQEFIEAFRAYGGVE